MIRTLTLMAALMAAPAAEAACTVIGPSTVHTPDGALDGAYLILQGDHISAVMQGNPRIGGCDRIEVAPGSALTPGLIATETQLGVTEVGLEKATRDDQWDHDPVRAAFRVIDAHNPRTSLSPVARLGGITTAIVVPTGGFVSGQAGAVDLTGGSQSRAIVATSVSVEVHLGALGSKGAGLARLRELLTAARYVAPNGYIRAGQALRDTDPLDLAALKPVLRRSIPLSVHVDRASDIEAVVRLADELAVRLIVVGGAEAWLVADQLAASNVPVVLDPLIYGPGSFGAIHAREDNAALLHAAGVPVILSAFSSHNARTTRVVAGNAVRGGLDHAAALAAITRHPAEAFGLDGRGVIQVGAVANVALWSGDPLEIGSALTGLWIQGESMPLRSRQTALEERYRTLPAARLPGE